MKKQIIRKIDSMIGYLKMVKKLIADGKSEQIETPDILCIVSILLAGTFDELNEYLKFKDAA